MSSDIDTFWQKAITLVPIRIATFEPDKKLGKNPAISILCKGAIMQTYFTMETAVLKFCISYAELVEKLIRWEKL